MLEENPNYFIELKSMTIFQKIDELYDMYIYFLEKDEFEKCSVIKDNITTLREKYHVIIKGNDLYE
jgi:protein-arginine kinase activator protein McsA